MFRYPPSFARACTDPERSVCFLLSLFLSSWSRNGFSSAPDALDGASEEKSESEAVANATAFSKRQRGRRVGGKLTSIFSPSLIRRTFRFSSSSDITRGDEERLRLKIPCHYEPGMLMLLPTCNFCYPLSLSLAMYTSCFISPLPVAPRRRFSFSLSSS